MKTIKLLIYLLMLTVFLLPSCSQDDEALIPSGEGEAPVQISISLLAPQEIRTRDTSIEGNNDENSVERFEVFLFEASGQGRLVASGENEAYSESSPWVLLKPNAGTYRMCVVTNYEKIAPGAAETYESFKSAVLDDRYIPFGSDTSLDDGSPRVVMYGEQTVTLSASYAPEQITMKVRRAVAKLRLTLWNELPAGHSYAIKRVSLYNAPQSTPLIEGCVHVAGLSAPQTLFEDDNGIEPDGENKLLVSGVYMFENMAGTVDASDTDQKKKGERAEAIIDSGKSPAYILIEGVYREQWGTDSGVSQKIYLGQNNYNDFNVGRNELHDYQIKVTSEGHNDTRVTISEYVDMQFISTPAVQDCHYTMVPITFSSKGTGGAGWTLTSDQQWLFFQKELNEWQRQGYWTEPGEAPLYSISGEDGDNITVYALLVENTDYPVQMRSASLTLKQTGSNEVKATLGIEQLPVNWTGEYGTERREEYVASMGEGYRFGFDWTRKVEYGYWGILGPWYRFVTSLYDDDSVSMNDGWGWFSQLRVTIDYSKRVGTVGAESTNDGLENTWNLYNEGVADISGLEQYLKDSGFTLRNQTGNWNDVEYYASKICMLKNKFRLKAASGEGGVYYLPDIYKEEVEWYLPAINQLPFSDTEETPTDGSVYWSSTAISNESPAKAWGYTVGSGGSKQTRDSQLRIRCVRRNL